MKVVLTDAVSQGEMIVETDLIRLIEAGTSGNGSHIVFDSLMGRMVNETPQQIASLIGVAVPPPSPVAPTPTEVAATQAKAKKK
jgi:hypothetical protein